MWRQSSSCLSPSLGCILAAGLVSSVSSAQQCCDGNITSFCGGEPSQHGCIPAFDWIGTPSSSTSSGFEVVLHKLPGGRMATFFYGLDAVPTPWAIGGSRGLCLDGPIQRVGVTSTSGHRGRCDGELRVDLQSWMASHPLALGTPFSPGQTLWLQGWYRDEAPLSAPRLSEALRFTLCDAVPACPPAPPGFVAIRPGSFEMGSNANPGYPYYNSSVNQPVHTVVITYPFWMATKEVTQRQFLDVMGYNPSAHQGDPRLPVEQVNWAAACAFCDAWTLREAASVPSGYEYRLPTEAEWEYACRAGSTTEFNVGSALDCDDAHVQSGSHGLPVPYCESTGTVPVGCYLPNAWGLCDMHGNVAEWCLDSESSYTAATAVDPFTGGGFARIFRSGGWDTSAVFSRSARRYSVPWHFWRSNLGFRMVLAPALDP